MTLRITDSRLNNAGARLRPFGLRLTRRRLLAASGATLAAGAPAALAACGTVEEDEDVSPEEEAGLLNQVLPQQLAVIEAAKQAIKAGPADAVKVAKSLDEERLKSTQELEAEINDLGGTPASEAADLVGAESAVEGLARQLEASIAATLEPLGELSPESRQPVHRAVVQDAAALAAVRDTLGEEPAPDAFVMGPPSNHPETES